MNERETPSNIEQMPSETEYFVDESGDPTLFDSKGQSLVGTPGCSRFFILGLLEVANPIGLTERLDTLRAKLLADPYFREVPSMQEKANKTATMFHAKDDLPEVRREVFNLLLTEDVRFFAVIRSKKATIKYVTDRNRLDNAYHYHPNELYDYLVRSLFLDRLHQSDRYVITFAHRGRKDRTQALREAIEAARKRFAKKWDRRVTNADIKVQSDWPYVHGGLQAVDYFLWALQRLYERREDRFIKLLWDRCRLVRDLDDTRKTRYGTYYGKKTPPDAALLENHPGI